MLSQLSFRRSHKCSNLGRAKMWVEEKDFTTEAKSEKSTIQPYIKAGLYHSLVSLVGKVPVSKCGRIGFDSRPDQHSES